MAPLVLVGLHAVLYGRWIVDDAAITFAYARSVEVGDGPVLQPDAAVVEGYSNPSWLALLVAGRWLGLFDRGAWFGVPDYVAFPKLLGLVCCAGVFACYYAVARASGPRPLLVTLVAGSVLAGVPSFVIWTMSGLENGLLALAVAGLAAVLVRAATAERLLEWRPAVACGLLTALAALTRPDGLVYAGAYPLAVLVLLRRHQLRRAALAVVANTAAFAVPAGVYLVWRLGTFGQVLPNTALAKAQRLPGLDSFARPGELITYIGWPAVLLGGVCVGAALVRRWPGRAGLVMLLVPLGLAVVAYAVLEPDWMGEYRFATPVWVLGALVGAIGVVRALAEMMMRGRAVIVVMATGAAVVSGVELVDAARAFRAAPTAPLCLVAQNTGRNINTYAEAIAAPQRATLLAPDVGGAAMVSNMRIVDLAGLTDATIAGFWRTADWTGLRDHIFEIVRPTFIKSHGGWSTTTGLASDPRLVTDYTEVMTTAGTTDWVRRDALAGPEQLARLQVVATAIAVPADTQYRKAPRSSCGLRLTSSGQ